MAAVSQPSASSTNDSSPMSFLTAAAALAAIDDALRDAYRHDPDTPDALGPGPEQALASLLLLRQVREELAGWETGLIETARDAGASWADLASPLGVASRQAAERRYLRGRPGPAGSTGEQRVTATRQARAADRSTAAWARRNAGTLRRLAGQITALTDLPAEATALLERLQGALADNDAAALTGPLTDTLPHLQDHPDIAAHLSNVTHHMDQLRQNSTDQRRAT
ncbi:type III effector protein [Streptomyces sp. NPDC127084]|uniref:type III effector protein n=1 Tax=Streptomyces sp. NPDC127084 TaxID=3347133 RepID=UPI003647B39E